MIKFKVKFFLYVDNKIIRRQYLINAESPKEAVEFGIEKNRVESDTPVAVGDLAMVIGQTSAYRGHFIVDLGLEPLEVPRAEFDFWSKNIANMIPIKLLGVKKAIETLL